MNICLTIYTFLSNYLDIYFAPHRKSNDKFLIGGRTAGLIGKAGCASPGFSKDDVKAIITKANKLGEDRNPRCSE